MKKNGSYSLGQCVNEDFRVASIFEKYGVNYYCNGKMSLGEASERYGFCLEQMLKDLEILGMIPNMGLVYHEMETLELLQYIEVVHHVYVRKCVPILIENLEDLVEKEPELLLMREVLEVFRVASTSLLAHLDKEEEDVFPFIRAMIKSLQEQESMEMHRFEDFERPLYVMEEDHFGESALFDKIKLWTNNFEIYEGCSDRYRSCMMMLKDFGMDLQKHIHLENNMLFCQARELLKYFEMV